MVGGGGGGWWPAYLYKIYAICTFSLRICGNILMSFFLLSCNSFGSGGDGGRNRSGNMMMT